MRKRTVTLTAPLLAGVVALAGCGASAPSTSTPAHHGPSATPSHPASAATLSARLRAAGLPVRHLIVYTETTDPNHDMGRQGEYTSKTAWVDPRTVKAGAGKPVTADEQGDVSYGGGIEAFPDTASARDRYDYLRGFKPPFGDGYDYLAGTAILRLSQYLTPTQAHAYLAAFQRAGSS